MKKFYFSILFLFFICISKTQSIAQVKFGPKLGISYPFMAGVNHFSAGLYEPKYLFKNDLFQHAGIIVDIPVFRFLSIQPELLLNQSGYSWYGPIQYDHYLSQKNTTYVEPDQTEYLSFISVPLLLKLKAHRFGLVFGPQFDRLVSAKRGVIANQKKVKVNDDYDFSVNYSAAAGIEYNFKFGLGLSARYQFGIGNIAKPSDTGLYDEGNQMKNNMATGSIFYLFGKKK